MTVQLLVWTNPHLFVEIREWQRRIVSLMCGSLAEIDRFRFQSSGCAWMSSAQALQTPIMAFRSTNTCFQSTHLEAQVFNRLRQVNRRLIVQPAGWLLLVHTQIDASAQERSSSDDHRLARN